MTTQKYTGRDQDRRYTGEQVDITYSAKRCIHAAECVRRLADVFDTQKRPWINADGAPADVIADVVPRCPSGALHYERKDGGTGETVPDRNTITLWHNGPLQFNGDLSIHGAAVEVINETRATLCRCGQSKNKPFCDNSHKESGFEAVTIAPIEGKSNPQTEGGALKITAHANGPLEVEGSFEIHDEAGNIIFSGSKTWLCRCGGSGRKPFCDSTHKTNGFQAD